MFWIRLKSWANHSPNELKRSLGDFDEATNSQNSGSRKYAKNASMNSSDANDRRGRRPARRGASTSSNGVDAARATSSG